VQSLSGHFGRYYEDALLALQVGYSDGRGAFRLGLCGTYPSVDVNFDIDGPGGERITAVNAFYLEPDSFVGFRVCALTTVQDISASVGFAQADDYYSLTSLDSYKSRSDSLFFPLRSG